MEPDSQLSPALLKKVVYAAAREAIRNAAKHGRGGDKARALHLYVNAEWREGLLLEIQDDGVGIVTSNGSGQGLQLHSTMMAVIGGSLNLAREGDKTRVVLSLPPGAW